MTQPNTDTEDHRTRPHIETARWAALTVGPMALGVVLAHAMGGSFEADEWVAFGDSFGPVITVFTAAFISIVTVVVSVLFLPRDRRTDVAAVVLSIQFGITVALYVAWTLLGGTNRIVVWTLLGSLTLVGGLAAGRLVAEAARPSEALEPARAGKAPFD